MTSSREDRRPYVQVWIQDRPFLALIDSGASRSFIGQEVVSLCTKLKLKPLQNIRPSPPSAVMADGTVVPVPSAYKFNFNVETHLMEAVFLFLPALTVDIILGVDVLATYGFSIDHTSNTVSIAQQHVRRPTSASVNHLAVPQTVNRKPSSQPINQHATPIKPGLAQQIFRQRASTV